MLFYNCKQNQDFLADVETEHRKRATERKEKAIDVFDSLPTVDEKWSVEVKAKKTHKGERLVKANPLGAEQEAATGGVPSVLREGDSGYTEAQKSGALTVQYEREKGAKGKSKFKEQYSLDSLFVKVDENGGDTEYVAPNVNTYRENVVDLPGELRTEKGGKLEFAADGTAAKKMPGFKRKEIPIAEGGSKNDPATADVDFGNNGGVRSYTVPKEIPDAETVEVTLQIGLKDQEDVFKWMKNREKHLGDYEWERKGDLKLASCDGSAGPGYLEITKKWKEPKVRFYGIIGEKEIGVGEADTGGSGAKNSLPVGNTHGGGPSSAPGATRLPTIHEDDGASVAASSARAASTSTNASSTTANQQQRLRDLEARMATYKPAGVVGKEREERARRREALMSRLGLASRHPSAPSQTGNGATDVSAFPFTPAQNAHRGSPARAALRMLLGSRDHADQEQGRAAGGAGAPTGKGGEDHAPPFPKPKSRMVDVSKWSGGTAANRADNFAEDSSSGDEDGLIPKKKKQQGGGGFSPLRVRFRGFGPLAHGLGPHVVVVRDEVNAPQQKGFFGLRSRKAATKSIQPAEKPQILTAATGDHVSGAGSQTPSPPEDGSHQEVFWPVLDLSQQAPVQTLVRRTKRGEHDPRFSDDDVARLAEQVVYDLFRPLLVTYLEFVESKMTVVQKDAEGMPRQTGTFYKLRIPISLIFFPEGISSEDRARVVTKALKDARGSAIRSELGPDRFDKVAGLASVHLNYDEGGAAAGDGVEATSQHQDGAAGPSGSTSSSHGGANNVTVWHRVFRQQVSGVTRQSDLQWLEVCDRLRQGLEALEAFEEDASAVNGEQGEQTVFRDLGQEEAEQIEIRKKLENKFEAVLEEYVKMRGEREEAAKKARAAKTNAPPARRGSWGPGSNIVGFSDLRAGRGGTSKSKSGRSFFGFDDLREREEEDDEGEDD